MSDGAPPASHCICPGTAVSQYLSSELPKQDVIRRTQPTPSRRQLCQSDHLIKKCPSPSLPLPPASGLARNPRSGELATHKPVIPSATSPIGPRRPWLHRRHGTRTWSQASGLSHPGWPGGQYVSRRLSDRESPSDHVPHSTPGSPTRLAGRVSPRCTRSIMDQYLLQRTL